MFLVTLFYKINIFLSNDLFIKGSLGHLTSSSCHFFKISFWINVFANFVFILNKMISHKFCISILIIIIRVVTSLLWPFNCPFNI